MNFHVVFLRYIIDLKNKLFEKNERKNYSTACTCSYMCLQNTPKNHVYVVFKKQLTHS